MMYIDDVIVPLVRILKNHDGDVRVLLATAKSSRDPFVELYEKNIDELDLTKLPKEEKNKLWEESKICEDRLAWCKAVRFWEGVR